MLLELERENPSAPALLCMLGALASQLGAEGMAMDFFRRCLAEEPMDPQLLVVAGAGLAQSGDPAGEAALRLAALTAPSLPAARMHYGAYLVRAGLIEQGLEELNAARELDPEDPLIVQELATALLMGGATEPALDAFEAAAAAEPDDPELGLLFGLALLQDGDTARAAEVLYPLGEKLADDGEAQLVLALTFALEGWEEEGWLALSRAEAADAPPDPALLREVEEALAADVEEIRSLLLEAIAPSALRDRTVRG
jgi:Flp pilus assembly protein TadD